MQLEASTKLADLFPNREGITIDIAEEEPDVDEDSMKEAGDLGVPFMEPDHDGERGVGGVG